MAIALNKFLPAVRIAHFFSTHFVERTRVPIREQVLRYLHFSLVGGRRWSGISSTKNEGAVDCSTAPWLVPSPRYFAKLSGTDYCNGLSVAVAAAAVLKRITPDWAL